MKGCGHSKDVRAIDFFKNVQIFFVFRFDADRNAGVGKHDVHGGFAVKVPSRGKECCAVGDVERIGGVCLSVLHARKHGVKLFLTATDKTQLSAHGIELLGHRSADAAGSPSDENAHYFS